VKFLLKNPELEGEIIHFIIKLFFFVYPMAGGEREGRLPMVSPLKNGHSWQEKGQLQVAIGHLILTKGAHQAKSFHRRQGLGYYSHRERNCRKSV
jgi:hypothetical protein